MVNNKICWWPNFAQNGKNAFITCRQYMVWRYQNIMFWQVLPNNNETCLIIYLLLKSYYTNYKAYNFHQFLGGIFKNKMFWYLQTRMCRFFLWRVQWEYWDSLCKKNYVWGLGMTQKSLLILLIFFMKFFGPKIYQYLKTKICQYSIYIYAGYMRVSLSA